MLTNTEVLMLCIADTYRFQVAGLFNGETRLVHTASFPLKVDNLAISFRFFFPNSSATLRIQVNDKVVWQKHMDTGATVPVVVNSTELPSAAVISTDPSNYLESIFTPIQTGLLAINSF